MTPNPSLQRTNPGYGHTTDLATGASCWSSSVLQIGPGVTPLSSYTVSRHGYHSLTPTVLFSARELQKISHQTPASSVRPFSEEESSFRSSVACALASRSLPSSGEHLWSANGAFDAQRGAPTSALGRQLGVDRQGLSTVFAPHRQRQLCPGAGTSYYAPTKTRSGTTCDGTLGSAITRGASTSAFRRPRSPSSCPATYLDLRTT